MRNESLYARVPIGAGTDQLRLCVEEIAQPFAGNMARLAGEIARPERYIDEMIAGFESTYRGLMAMKARLLDERGPLGRFKRAPVRVILRSTQVYSYLLGALAHPDYLRRGKGQKRDDLLARIRPDRTGPIVQRRCWPAERAALLRGDVPYFTAAVDSKDLRDDCGNILPALCKSPGRNESRRRIRALSMHDLDRQRRLLHQAVICLTPFDTSLTWENRHPKSPLQLLEPVDLCVHKLVDEAVRIAEHIIAAGFLDGRYRAGPNKVACGCVTHIQLESRGQHIVRPYALGPALYNGLAGLAVFLGELWLRTGEPRFLLETETALASARWEYSQSSVTLEPIGAFSGVSGWVYTLALLGRRLDRPEWVEEAIGWLPWLADRVDKDLFLDVIGGTAGALLVLTELDRIAPGRGAFDVARKCAEHLEAKATRGEGSAGWLCHSSGDRPLTGFSHGTAGIAAALARFAARGGGGRYFELAREALRFERKTYDHEVDGWPMLRSERDDDHGRTEHPYAWCHGAPGIGLGRLALPSEMRDAAWFGELDNCIRLTAMHGFGGSHCLCHGQFGNLELLMRFGTEFPDRSQSSLWRHAAQRLLEEGQKGWRPGGIAEHDLLGFMTGMAGIGFALLRIADPRNTPSVLMLELSAATSD
jgi:type 2 lantibiotic biosynthesis protein LanM